MSSPHLSSQLSRLSLPSCFAHHHTSSPVIVVNAIASPTISPIAIELGAPEPSRPLVSSITAPIVALIISLFIVLLNSLAHTVTSPLIATLARLSLRVQRYIRNHARLKYARFDIATQ